MKAEQTVMDDEQVVAEMKRQKWGRTTIAHRTPLDERTIQADISFKAGIQEVVDWINKELPYSVGEMNPFAWQAKLKEWGLEE